MARTRIDRRRLKRTQTYTVPEAAASIGVSIGTVRRWVREGLPLIDDKRPQLIHGGAMREWLANKALARKVRCGPRQIYCCKCRDARDILPGSAVIIHRNEKAATVRALCIECGANMFRHCSKIDASIWMTAQHPLSRQTLTLIASRKPLAIVHSRGLDERDPENRKEGDSFTASTQANHRRSVGWVATITTKELANAAERKK